MKIRRILVVFIIIPLMFSVSPAATVRATGSFQGNLQATPAQELLNKMTTEERVGQLFLVAFNGPNADEKSQIYDLITRYHIGGVVLRAENDNFIAAADTVTAAYQLVAQLQNAERQASVNRPSSTPEAGTPTALPAPTAVPANYIPLLVGISQDGDGYPNDQILDGLTRSPI